jgi:hypothetical protein
MGAILEDLKKEKGEPSPDLHKPCCKGGNHVHIKDTDVFK